ncbi:MAG: DUF2383 domain-containing protein [Luteolibacter sp.]|uniref:DUF2383 domain-containing protein n=1 Tax=Luteolibacter sp. TaxID=1962973 RepID=UPI003264A351
MNTTDEHCLKICNGLLRGELSAVESYGRVIEMIDSSSAKEGLQRISNEHSQSARWLSALVRAMNGIPEKNSAVWGQVPGGQIRTEVAVQILRSGEVSVRNGYQRALLDDEVLTDCKLMIREDILPKVIRHIDFLERLHLEVP